MAIGFASRIPAEALLSPSRLTSTSSSRRSCSSSTENFVGISLSHSVVGWEQTLRPCVGSFSATVQRFPWGLPFPNALPADLSGLVIDGRANGGHTSNELDDPLMFGVFLVRFQV